MDQTERKLDDLISQLARANYNLGEIITILSSISDKLGTVRNMILD